MGGRSKVRAVQLPDRFAWLKDVSNERLDRYGEAGRTRYLAGSEDPARKTGFFDAVWDNAAIEYEARHGVKPKWAPSLVDDISLPNRLVDSPSALPLGSNLISESIVSSDSYKNTVYSGPKRGYAGQLNGKSFSEIESIGNDLKSRIHEEKISGDVKTRKLRIGKLQREYNAVEKVLEKIRNQGS